MHTTDKVTAIIEYRCHLCGEWMEALQTEPHFSGAHAQPGVTFEKLEERLMHLGGMDVRVQSAPSPESDQIAPVKKHWLMDDPDSTVFETNNFQHAR